MDDYSVINTVAPSYDVQSGCTVCGILTVPMKRYLLGEKVYLG